MSNINPDKPYVYQPFGPVTHADRAAAGRLYAVGGLSFQAKIEGLTKAEAEVVRDALIRLKAREELTRIGQEIGDY